MVSCVSNLNSYCSFFKYLFLIQRLHKNRNNKQKAWWLNQQLFYLVPGSVCWLRRPSVWDSLTVLTPMSMIRWRISWRLGNLGWLQSQGWRLAGCWLGPHWLTHSLTEAGTPQFSSTRPFVLQEASSGAVMWWPQDFKRGKKEQVPVCKYVSESGVLTTMPWDPHPSSLSFWQIDVVCWLTLITWSAWLKEGGGSGSISG